MKKILITGSTGMLGSDLVRLFSASRKYEVYGLGRSLHSQLPRENQIVLDLSVPCSNLTWDIIPDVIVHAAALTDLNLCERDPQLANRIHVEGSESVAKLSGEKTKFFYISTDSVFDGIKGSYTENDQPRPVNEYASSKLGGEMIVKKTAKGEVIILRTNIYGFHVPMKNSLAEWAFREWRAGKAISGFTDTIFNAVFTQQLAILIKWMIDQNIFHPVLNVGAGEAISKFDFLDRFREQLNVDQALLAKAISTDFQSPVLRPRNTSLDVSLLSTFYKVPNFDEGMQHWINLNPSLNR